MSRYIDVDKTLEAMDTWPKYGCKPDGRFFKLTKETEADYVPYVHYDDMVQAVTGTPVQDVAPVVHAHWVVDDNEQYYCSACMDGHHRPMFFIPHPQWRHCPWCGAKMDEEVE